MPVCVVTQVKVDIEDPAFLNPTKPVGPFFTEDEARRRMGERNETWIEDAGRGWRRVVPSPDPKEKDPQVFVLETFVASAISEALEQELFADLMGNDVEERIFDENGYYWMKVLEVMDELEFWDTYYPSRQVLDSVTVQDQTGTDSIVEFISPGDVPATALERMAREKEQQLFNLARLRSIIKPYLDAIDPKPEWKPLDRY